VSHTSRSAPPTLRPNHLEPRRGTPPRRSSVRRYYDPQTGQFLSVDPAVDQTEAAYTYVNGDPVDTVDPFGLGCGSWLDPHPLGCAQAVGSALSHGAAGLASAITTPSIYNPAYDLVNAVAVIPYAAYYIAYRTLSSIGAIPVVGFYLTLATPASALYITEWLGLEADEGIDIFKNWAFCNGEKAADEGGPIYPTSIHAGPQIYGPGLHPNGRKDLYPAHSYPWWQGFSPNRNPNAG
jgi:hypothetical protein